MNKYTVFYVRVYNAEGAWYDYDCEDWHSAEGYFDTCTKSDMTKEAYIMTLKGVVYKTYKKGEK